MLPLLIFLGVPFLGALLVAAEHVRRYGETPFSRKTGRTTVLGIGGLLGLLGGLSALTLVGFLAVGAMGGSWLERVFEVTTVLVATTLVLFAARNALRVGMAKYADESVTTLARHARDSDELQLSGWLLVAAPLLLLGVFGLIVMLPLLLFGIVSWTARRARESQFLWILALAVENDLPLDDEVEAFSLTLWRRNRRKYGDVAARMREGRSLIDALEIGGVLSRPLVAEFRAAQAVGTLPQAVRKAAATHTTSLLHNRFDGSIAVTTVYLWSVLLMIFFVVCFLMYWIIPKFKDIFNDFGMDLPGWTRQAITLSDSFVDNYLFVMPVISLPIVAGLIVAIVGIAGWGNLNFPLLMRWFPRRDAPGLLRSLAYAVDSGRPLPESFEEMAEHQRRTDLRGRLQRMMQSASMGDPLWTTLAAEGFIYRSEAGALEAAARADNLSWALRTLAGSMQRTSRHRVQFWLEFLKPAAIIAVGCVVAFFVIAFFLPLVKLIGELT